MAKPVKDQRKARRQAERAEKKQKKHARHAVAKGPVPKPKRRHDDALPAPPAKRAHKGGFQNRFMEMIHAQAAEGSISLDSAKVLKKPASKAEISEEDLALKRLEKSLGLTKATGKAKLNKEFEKDGLGADFGDFLMGLDDLSARISSSKRTAEPSDDEASDDAAMDDDASDDDEGDFEGMDEETRREMELLAEEDAAFLQEMDQLPTDDEEEEDDDLAQFESDLSDADDADEVAANTRRNQRAASDDELSDDEANSEDEADADSDDDKLEEEVEADSDANEAQESDADDTTDAAVVVEEDIYGRPKVAAPAPSATRYVPPHLRREATTNEQQLRELRRRINGQLNRLSESNMEPICMEFESIYRSFVRADVNALLLEALVAMCCHETQVMSQLIHVSGALLGALFHSVGTEIVGFFIEHFVQRFEKAVVALRAQPDDDDRSKVATNLLLLITTLYMFDTVHCGMVYDVFRFLVESFASIDIELIHALLQACGPALRADDSSALSDMIATVQTKASAHEEQRVRFLLDLIYNLKKATKKSKGGAFSNDRVQQLRKWIGRVKSRVGHSNNALRVSFSELLNADAQGRWWIIGGTWVPPSHATAATEKTDSQHNALLKLAEKQRMNTDVRRSIFCAIMGASDCVEAYDAVLKLGLKDKQEREVIRVLMHCCGHEAKYNPYYALLAEKFAAADPRYKFTLQLAYWDVFKQVDEWKPRKVYNMACLLAKLLETGAMTLAVLKVLDFTDLGSKTVLFLRVVFERILSIEDDSALFGVFERIAQQKSKMEATRDGVAVFFHQHMLAVKDPVQKKKAKLEPRASEEETKETAHEDDEALVEFQVGNPRVEVLTGRLRLFRSDPSPAAATSADDGPRQWQHLSTETILSMDLTLLGFVSLPLHMGPLELLEFSKAFRDDIVLLRLLRDAQHPTRLALVQFSCATKAAQFYEAFNGSLFNSMEPERCKLVFVRQIEFVRAQAPGPLPAVNGHAVADGMLPAFESPPPAGHVEIPTCPVCLDRLDTSVSGILTTLCNHTFHCDCLFRWEGSSCPVCRYSHGDMVSTCEVCETTEHLWICLICGHIGCGRYSNEHAKRHYQETLHTYSLELETQRVWDYAGDGYVHRLILNKHDGKFVEFPNPNGTDDDGADHLKLEKLAAEYNHLLTSQLEEQRLYYERRLGDLPDRRTLDADRKGLKRQNDQLLKKTAQLEEELTFVRELNKSLIENQSQWKERVRVAEDKCAALEASTQARVDDLEAQVATIKDLMFYLDTQNKIEHSVHKSDIQSGSIHTTQVADDSKKAAKRSSKKR
ncbi:hypothetical protein ACHHYP_02206 [Achlya hypogyna]|uniref:MI domain-containing protein n=1 Tax=Achlya hypogyna TaxID=1202772 RepID=A0A1V9Z771_ACHHY|nr:hypothetical protein ACHHYP_02206 [Achlya hypogyna]